MPRDTALLPIIGRAASVRPDSIDPQARTVEVVWTTGATVQRRRWEGWDDLVEYDEELVVSANAVRLERLNAGAPFLDSHDSWSLRSVLGSVVPGSARVEGGKGYATIQLTEAEDVAGQVQRILEGTVRNVSVGYAVHRYEITKQEGAREHWRAVDWEPMEISAVPIPADYGAQTRSAESRAAAYPCVLIRAQDTTAAGAANRKEGQMPKDRDQRADDQNAPRQDQQPGGNAPAPVEPPAPAGGDATPTPQAPASTTPSQEGSEPGPASEAQRAIAVERQRTHTINQLCRRHGLDGDFADDLIARGISIEAARGAILDQLAERDPFEGRSYEPARPRDDGSAGAGYRRTVEAALMHRINPSAELPDAAREFRGMTLMEIARHALERSGVNTRGMGKMELAQTALGQRSAVGYHTTGDFPGVLANIGTQTLRAAYGQVPRTFTAWARRASLTDFRPTRRVQVSNAPQLELVPEGAEFTYGTFGEAGQQYALATYGRIIAFTRQMMINDDLGAFTRVSQSFGARAAQLEADIVYNILLKNPVLEDGEPLFDESRGNLGAPSAITEEALTEAMTAFALQTDIDGTAIDVSPEYLLVPPGARAVEAQKILAATAPGTTADVNVYANALTPIVERRLLRADGASPWFLAASSALLDTVEYAYLDGQDGVYTETRNGFEVDGVEIKARLDFAAAPIDARGIYKNPGV